jgi:DNA invertase Pin-like site-specific DNA recombinase
VSRCAAVYARYSSDLQSPTSIEDQVRLCRAHADHHGWTVVATFEDAALSGFGTEQRPGYQQLLAAALGPAPAFDVILVEDLSRLTRDMAELLLLTARLRLRGVELVGVSDGIATGRQGAKVQLAVKGLMNELYLDDLRDKTHRGLTGQLARGWHTGGRIFGYRTVPIPTDTPRRSAPARVEVEPTEAGIVRRIFAAYAAGRSLVSIAHALNAEAVPFPAKDTQRGPARRGWAVSTLGVILDNGKYVGMWTWNKTRFLKDPDTGRRRPVPRPESEWIRQERPDLRIIDANLWAAVQARRAATPRTRGGRRERVSTYLLSGLVRCGGCGARMIAQRTTRRKAGRVYGYGWYRCSFAAHKGPAVCTHGTWYRQDPLEAVLLEKFRAATTAPMLDALVRLVSQRVDAAGRARDAHVERAEAEILRLESEAGHLVRFLRGGESTTVREELTTIESALQGLRVELASLQATRPPPPVVSRPWIQQRVDELAALVTQDPVRARVEIRKHLDGDLELVRGPERQIELRGHVKPNSLLVAQEAVGGLSPGVGCGGAPCLHRNGPPGSLLRGRRLMLASFANPRRTEIAWEVTERERCNDMHGKIKQYDVSVPTGRRDWGIRRTHHQAVADRRPSPRALAFVLQQGRRS